MKKPRDYTLAARSFALLVACFWLIGIAGPHVWMHGYPFGSPASAEAAPRQIPVQKPAADQKKPVGITKVQVNLVRLYATVRDHHGAIIPNLKKNDFHIYEDGKEQQISFFSKDMTDPVTLGLLIDTSGSEQYMLGAEKETASEFLRQFVRKDDLVMVMSFDTEVNLLADFTDSPELLQKAIERAEINSPATPVNAGPFPSINQTGTALYDAIYLACTQELPEQTGRKALVILTDAQDEGSTENLNDAILAAQQANVVIHVLLIADPRYSFSIGYIGGSVAHKLAEETGGRVISVRRDKDLQKAFDEISQELRSQYILAYYPTDVSANGAFRKIKIETTNSSLHVLTRKGYYAPSRQTQ